MCSRTALKTIFASLAAGLLVAGGGTAVRAQVFRSDDPVRIDHDDLPSPKPRRTRINDYYDFLENTFLGAGSRQARRAVNINTLGDVPNSSWYTNRLSRGRLPLEELVRGANRGSGPAEGPWTVTAGKTQGITPGFTIRDSRGDVYFLKFDPETNPEMATAAEVISSKFFHAFGYNVPEYSLVTFRPADLRIAPDARVRNELDEEEPLTREFVDALLGTVARRPDGTVRAIASKRVAGENLGPFKFYGTRSDDPNDVFPHEDRRELRGYYVFCSWLNHDDSRSVNTLDMYVGEPGRGHTRHYLIDFGSTLGSASIFAQKRRAGNEYLWEAAPTFASMASLGIWLRPWVVVEYPDLPSIGRFEADFFQPEEWKPEYPNPAFRLMDDEDAFWAARQLRLITDEDVRAVVRTGRLSDPNAEDYLVRCLIRRRDKVVDYWLRRVAPLDGFRIEGNVLHFETLLAGANAGWEATFFGFDNSSGLRTALAAPVPADSGRIPLPAVFLEPVAGADAPRILGVRIAGGMYAAEVFVRRAGSELEVVGMRRN